MNWIIILEKTRDEMLKSVGKSAAFSSVADGAMASTKGEGPGHVIKEMIGGAITGASGAAAKEAFEHFTKNTGPMGLVVGVGASVATRYAFRRLTNGSDDTRPGEDGRADEGPRKLKNSKAAGHFVDRKP